MIFSDYTISIIRQKLTVYVGKLVRSHAAEEYAGTLCMCEEVNTPQYSYIHRFELLKVKVFVKKKKTKKEISVF